MELQKRVVKFLLFIVLMHISLMALILIVVWMPKLISIVEDESLHEINIGETIIKREISNLSVLAKDYGTWDDTYDFARTGSQKYVETNFTDETFQNTRLSHLIIYGAYGNILYKYIKHESDESVSPLFPERSDKSNKIFETQNNNPITGLLSNKQNCIIFAAMPIVHSDGSGPATGYIIMARDIHYLKKALVNYQDLDIDYIFMGNGDAERLKEIVDKMRNSGADYLYKDKKNKTNRYRIVKDIYGSEALIIHSKTDRKISAIGKNIGIFVTIANIILGIIVTILLAHFITKIIVKPLKLITFNIGKFSSDKITGTDLVAITERTDEIGKLGRAFNEMENNIILYNRQLKELNESLEDKINDRTSDLIMANTRLKLFEKILASTTEGVIITDLRANTVQVNDAFCKMAGYTEDELIGKNPRILKSDKHDERFYKSMWEEITSEGGWSGEIWDRKKNGEIFPKWLTITAINDENGKPVNYVGLSSDITKIKLAEEQLLQLAYYDVLTGLPNRCLFYERLERAIAHNCRYKSGRFAVLFIDLDRFKNINDTLGHAAGDELLIEISRKLNSRIRESDTVCRLGGDEFTIILDKINRGDDAGKVATDIIEDIKRPTIIQDKEIFIGASIGIAIYPDDDESVHGLIRKADAAMYNAKEAGKGQYCFVSQALDEYNRKKLNLEINLRHALEKNELEIYYQAQMSAQADNGIFYPVLTGCEALIRWLPESAPMIYPDEFIKIAEETGLIIPIGKWIITESCRHGAKWERMGTPLRIGVNLSGKQFTDPDLFNHIKTTLNETGLNPQNLQLEITESMFLDDITGAIAILTELKNIGVTIAIDDFGTGYSSLSYLKDLPVDYLKIDKSFVNEITDDNRNSDIVTAIISMAKVFKMKIIAEGVENEVQMRSLFESGCDELQGYLFSKPINLNSFEALISDKKYVLNCT